MQRQMIKYAMLTSRKHAQRKKRKKQRNKESENTKARETKRIELNKRKWTEEGRLTVQKNQKVRRFGSKTVRTIMEAPFPCLSWSSVCVARLRAFQMWNRARHFGDGLRLVDEQERHPFAAQQGQASQHTVSCRSFCLFWVRWSSIYFEMFQCSRLVKDLYSCLTVWLETCKSWIGLRCQHSESVEAQLRDRLMLWFSKISHTLPSNMTSLSKREPFAKLLGSVFLLF